MPRRNPCSYLNRRLQIVLSLTGFLLFCILTLGSSSPDNSYINRVPYGPQIKSSADQVVGHLPSLPKDFPQVNTAQWMNRLDPFQAHAHKAPEVQPDSKIGDISWLSDFKWTNPFSSAVTRDDRSVLPPLNPRPPVYTFFDPAGQRKDEKTKKVELELLEIWRRAWWAQGFKPVVLSRAEAMNHPEYQKVQKLELESEMELEFMRWLAWGNMGTGILCNWLAVPMAHYDDPLLCSLRSGEYPRLTHYTALESGIFAGTKEHIDKALEEALSSHALSTAKSMIEVVPSDMVEESKHEGIAYYSSKIIRELYTPIGDMLKHEETRATGLGMLPALINSHLHLTWQNTFPKGIAVLKPLAHNTTSLIDPTIEIARNLSTCPTSPIQDSCPPNRPRCTPCSPNSPMIISTPSEFQNLSTLFTIGTVPHPYTLQSLIHNKEAMEVKYIRRNTSRDVWISETTKELLGSSISPFARLADFKDSVASEYGSSRSLWITAEDPIYLRTEKDMQEMDWIFGFKIPRAPAGESRNIDLQAPEAERRAPAPKQDYNGPKPSTAQLKRQKDLVDTAKIVIKKGEKSHGAKPIITLRNAVEAWNMADTEAWKFVRAFNARRQVERVKWQKEEEAYLGKGLVDRWRDSLTG